MEDHGTDLKSFAAGSTTGFFEHTLLFPIDTVKTHSQTSSSGYSTIFRKIYRGGTRSFYNGYSMSLASIVPAHGSFFMMYMAGKDLWINKLKLKDEIGWTLSSIGANIAHDTISTPFDVIKQRMQIGQNYNKSNLIDIAKNIYRSEGLSAFYRSLPMTLSLNLPMTVINTVTYETLVKRIDPDQQNKFSHLYAGMGAGLIAGSVTTPFDVIRTQMQTSNTKIIDIVKRQKLFSGMIPRTLYCSLSSGITWFTFNNIHDMMN